ncbi:MAG: ribonuclease Z [Chitinophagaceae bacterium]|nr:ribonuclease Z [Chitinophagaceae bacterium]
MLAVTILGNNSAIPAFDRHPTSQIVTLNDQLFLVDCGEGTQMQIARYRIRRSRINHIFISHLHGDHYFGLIGLITSMGLLGRDQDLHLYAPALLRPIIEMQLKVADTTLPFKLHFYALEAGLLVSNHKFEVSCFKVYHRIDCWGFVFKEIRAPRKINPEKAVLLDIPVAFYDELRQGKDFITPEGNEILNEEVTFPNVPGKSYAYSADTLYHESLALHVKGVDLLYHEATYLKDLSERAAKRFHSTTLQAATTALNAGVQKLILGHFSSKYESLTQFEREAKEIFGNTEVALEGVTYKA